MGTWMIHFLFPELKSQHLGEVRHQLPLPCPTLSLPTAWPQSWPALTEDSRTPGVARLRWPSDASFQAASCDPEEAPDSMLDKKPKLATQGQGTGSPLTYHTEEEGSRGISGLHQSPSTPFSTWTYPVLARLALTLTHTATKMAGRPVGTEGAACEGP